MKYFFIPGRLQHLSWKELNSVLGVYFQDCQYILKKHPHYYILDTDLDISHIFHRLGGFVKYGVVLDSDLDIQSLVDSEKFSFGISSYTSNVGLPEIEKLSKGFKKTFQKLNKKPRFILPKEDKFLNAPQILNNNILEEGFELVILEDSFGKTLEVQNIQAFSKRDYEKPFVDKQMGVLPVKLARMMINFAEISDNKVLWDPFCGTGNILLEGLDLNYAVLGSDIDENALEGAKSNIRWAIEKFDYTQEGRVFFLDVLNPSRSKIDILNNYQIGGIVCEPYMGQAQRKVLESSKALGLIRQHFSLVSSMFRNLEYLNLKESIKVVVIFPEYKTKNGWMSVEKNLLKFKNTQLIEGKDLHWSRRDSIIRRLIFIFEYNSK